MIESMAHFLIGIMLAMYLMLMNWSSIKHTYRGFSYSKKWTGEMLVTFAIASFIMGAVYLIVRYGLYLCPYFSKKPLFSNELVDRKMTLSWKRMLGYALAGIGFGLGGMLFESFLLTVPSS